ncbi:MAG TPA: hypothetical protein PKE16_20365, partial [Hyphomicrobium sp.]|nr:hypothetical protein [Hyphomicrobium sp.]
VRKVAGGVRVGKPKAVVTAELGQPYRPDRINSDLIQTPTGGAAVWSLYRSGGGEAKTGINFISNTGEVSFPSLDISKRRKTAWEFLSSMTDSASYSCGPTSENEVSSLGFLIGMARLSASR